MLSQIADYAKAEHPDVILICGDIYDKSAPSGEDYVMFDRFLEALSEIRPRIPVLVIEGNHDSPERQDRAKPVLDALFLWSEEKRKVTPPKSALGKALHYLKEQWPYLVHYLEDGRLEIFNNRAERSIKPFVMGRKNWLFANTPAGARASAVIYSLIETAKETGLDPYKYFSGCSMKPPFETDREWAKKLTPEYCELH